jgi:hypothetical protein
MRWLRDTASDDLILTVLAESEISVLAESDSDHAGCVETRKPMCGDNVFLETRRGELAARMLITNGCCRLTVIARSSAEAELSAFVKMVQLRLIYIIEAIQQITNEDPNAVVRIDNQACIDMIRAGYSRTLYYMKRWVGVDLGWLHQLVYDAASPWSITLEKVNTLDNTADIYTKNLDAERFNMLRHNIGIRARGTTRARTTTSTRTASRSAIFK